MGGDEVGPVVVAAAELSAIQSAAEIAMIMMWRAMVGTLFTCTHMGVESDLDLHAEVLELNQQERVKAWTIHTKHSKRRHRVAMNIALLRPMEAARNSSVSSQHCLQFNAQSRLQASPHLPSASRTAQASKPRFVALAWDGRDSVYTL